MSRCQRVGGLRVNNPLGRRGAVDILLGTWVGGMFFVFFFLRESVW